MAKDSDQYIQLVKVLNNQGTKITHVETEQKKKAKIDALSPKILYDEVCKTVVGQEEAKKVICNTIFLHFVRQCQTSVTHEPVKKSNALLMGPTASGKTYIVREAARAMRELTGYDVCRMLEVDCTELSSRGWEGDNLSTLVGGHWETCGRSEDVFNTSIVFLDEFDKLCKSAVGKGGTDHNKMTQYNLLKIVEGTWLRTGGGKCETSNLLFIMAGNFSEIRSLRMKNQRQKLGFCDHESPDSYVDYHTELEKSGMATQLVGRVPHVAELYELTEEELMEILDRYILPEYRETWRFMDQKLIVPRKKKLEIVKNCAARKTGARGLHADVAKFIENILFDLELKL